MPKRPRDQGDTPPPKKPSDTSANRKIERREQRALRRKNLDPNAAETKIAGKRPRDPEETPPSNQRNAQKASDTSANRRDHRASAAELRAKRREEKAQRAEAEAQRRREEALAAIMKRLNLSLIHI